MRSNGNTQNYLNKSRADTTVIVNEIISESNFSGTPPPLARLTVHGYTVPPIYGRYSIAGVQVNNSQSLGNGTAITMEPIPA